MKRILLLISILIGSITTQAQDEYYTAHSSRGYWVNKHWVWDDAKDVEFKITIQGKNVSFDNQAKTRLKLITKAKFSEDETTKVWKYHATDKGENCIFKIVHWKCNGQIQFYVVYNIEQFVLTLE